MAPPSPSPSSSAHKPSETKWRLSSFVAATGISTEQAQSIVSDMEPIFYGSLRGYDGKSFSSKKNKALIDNALATAFASLPILQQVEKSNRPAAEACLRKLATYLKERGKFVYPKSVRSNGTAASRSTSPSETASNAPPANHQATKISTANPPAASPQAAEAPTANTPAAEASAAHTTAVTSEKKASMERDTEHLVISEKKTKTGNNMGHVILGEEQLSDATSDVPVASTPEVTDKKNPEHGATDIDIVDGDKLYLKGQEEPHARPHPPAISKKRSLDEEDNISVNVILRQLRMRRGQEHTGDIKVGQGYAGVVKVGQEYAGEVKVRTAAVGHQGTSQTASMDNSSSKASSVGAPNPSVENKPESASNGESLHEDRPPPQVAQVSIAVLQRNMRFKRY